MSENWFQEKVDAWFKECPQRTIIELMVDTYGALTDQLKLITELDNVYLCSDKMPPRPDSPYKTYLAFAVVVIGGQLKGGSWETLQFSRDDNQWMPISTRFGDPCVVTHWTHVPATPAPVLHHDDIVEV